MGGESPSRATLGKKGGLPGVILAIHTFGDVVNFHPRLHAITPPRNL